MKSPLTDSLTPRACPICRHPDAHAAGARDDGGQWQCCAACSAVYLSPAPDEAALARFYATYYSDYRRLQAPTRAALEATARARAFDPLTQFALQSVGRVPARVADVGCGQGARLVVLRALGASEVVGSEMDAEAARFARDGYDLPVHVGSADAIPVPGDGFDLVFLSEVIEHVLDPIALLRAIARLVRPGGFFCLSTPNAGVRHRAGKDWTQLHLDFDHLTLFDDASIRRALTEAGFVPVEVLPYGRPSISSERWQNEARGLPLPRWAERARNVARRVATNLRTPQVVLDPHDGYTLLCSARRPA